MTVVKQSRKKHYGITFLISIVAWGGWAYVFTKMQPTSISVYFLFIFLFYLALMVTMTLIVGNTRHSLLGSAGCMGLLFLSQFNQLTIVNTILFLGMLIVIEIYLRQR